jgi:hypothetical protein
MPPSILAPSERTLGDEFNARDTHAWAVEIVSNQFRAGMARVFDRSFMNSRFHEFVKRSDPIYVSLLAGMDDEGVARAVVGNWMVAHTLATQSRFWLEDAIIEMLIARVREGLEPRRSVYSRQMLADGWHASGKTIWDVGEGLREEIHGRGAWRPLIQENALREIEQIVGEEERRFEQVPSFARRDVFMTEEDDQQSLDRSSTALSGLARPSVVRCNLLVIEPERSDHAPHAWAIRYINPTTFGQASAIKAERANLLRLRAYLSQEKPFRAPGLIQVAIADLVPRASRESETGRTRNYFSSRTYWSAERLWGFLEVPFAAVTAGIREAGSAMRTQLGAELRKLLSTGTAPS